MWTMWSNIKPDIPGYYWMRHKDNISEPLIVEIAEFETKSISPDIFTEDELAELIVYEQNVDRNPVWQEWKKLSEVSEDYDWAPVVCPETLLEQIESMKINLICAKDQLLEESINRIRYDAQIEQIEVIQSLIKGE